ncbi:MAG: hypothetical protein Q8N53_14995 [Longimicrobiales bacterium]|nr:hypothetical protein [Longimicrobiales bacterium]
MTARMSTRMSFGVARAVGIALAGGSVSVVHAFLGLPGQFGRMGPVR